MTSLSNDLLCQLLEGQAQNAEVLGKMAGQLESLAGPEGRVTKLERAKATQFWVNIIVVPMIAFMHAIARRFGLEF